MSVEYFEQCLGAAHFKRWSNDAISHFHNKKGRKGIKRKKKKEKLDKNVYPGLHPNTGQGFYVQHPNAS